MRLIFFMILCLACLFSSGQGILTPSGRSEITNRHALELGFRVPQVNSIPAKPNLSNYTGDSATGAIIFCKCPSDLPKRGFWGWDVDHWYRMDIINAITGLTGDVVATGPGNVSATIQSNAVDYSKFQQVPGRSVLGRSPLTTGNINSINATDYTLLGTNNAALGFLKPDSNHIPDLHSKGYYDTKYMALGSVMPAAGNNTEIQYNNNGVLGASPQLKFAIVGGQPTITMVYAAHSPTISINSLGYMNLGANTTTFSARVSTLNSSPINGNFYTVGGDYIEQSASINHSRFTINGSTWMIPRTIIGGQTGGAGIWANSANLILPRTTLTSNSSTAVATNLAIVGITVGGTPPAAASSLWIEEGATGAVNNYALYVNSGLARLNTLAVGGTSIDASAQVDISSTSKGFLMPRMSAAQRISIGTPANALIVWDNDSSRFMAKTPSEWRGLAYTGESSGGATPALPDSAVQYRNSAGALAGSANFLYSPATGGLYVVNYLKFGTGFNDAQKLYLRQGSGINQGFGLHGGNIVWFNEPNGQYLFRGGGATVNSGTNWLNMSAASATFSGGVIGTYLSAGNSYDMGTVFVRDAGAGARSGIGTNAAADYQFFHRDTYKFTWNGGGEFQTTNAKQWMQLNSTNLALGTASPNASAKLDISSTSQGILIPRMTDAQVGAIASPATGLLAYGTTANTFYYYNSGWRELVNNLNNQSIGGTKTFTGMSVHDSTIRAGYLMSGGGGSAYSRKAIEFQPYMGITHSTTYNLGNAYGKLDIWNGSTGGVIRFFDSVINNGAHTPDRTTFAIYGRTFGNYGEGSIVASLPFYANAGLNMSHLTTTGLGGGTGAYSVVHQAKDGTGGPYFGTSAFLQNACNCLPTIDYWGGGSAGSGATPIWKWFRAEGTKPPTSSPAPSAVAMYLNAGDNPVLALPNAKFSVGSVPANTTAIAEFNSTTQGMLFPRMTAAQRIAITAPATSLIVWDLDSGRFMTKTTGIWKGLAYTDQAGSGGGGSYTFSEGLTNAGGSVTLGGAFTNNISITNSINATRSFQISANNNWGSTGLDNQSAYFNMSNQGTITLSVTGTHPSTNNHTGSFKAAEGMAALEAYRQVGQQFTSVKLSPDSIYMLMWNSPGSAVAYLKDISDNTKYRMLVIDKYTRAQATAPYPPSGGGSMVYPPAGIPVSTGSAWTTSVANNSDEWNVAYSWGDHAAAGYVETEVDPVFAASPAGDITNTQVTNWDDAYSWGNHGSIGYLVSEADPVFNLSAAKEITFTQIEQWSAAYGWGNHNAAGYLKNITGLVTAGSNVTITGSGTAASPYVINSSGSGGGGTSRFGFTGEDVSASAARSFNLNGYNFNYTGTGSIQVDGDHATNSKMRVGSLEFHSWDANSSSIMFNTFWNGTAYETRRTGNIGPSLENYFGNFQVGIKYATSPSAGHTFDYYGYPLIVDQVGTVAIGGYQTINAPGNISGASLMAFADGSVTMGKSTAAVSSALIEINSTSKGALLPRMTKAQRNAISTPVEGLMIYQTDNTPGLRVFNGTNWMKFTETAD